MQEMSSLILQTLYDVRRSTQLMEQRLAFIAPTDDEIAGEVEAFIQSVRTDG